jgi:hypothetical protein
MSERQHTYTHTERGTRDCMLTPPSSIGHAEIKHVGKLSTACHVRQSYLADKSIGEQIKLIDARLDEFIRSPFPKLEWHTMWNDSRTRALIHKSAGARDLLQQSGNDFVTVTKREENGKNEIVKRKRKAKAQAERERKRAKVSEKLPSVEVLHEVLLKAIIANNDKDIIQTLKVLRMKAYTTVLIKVLSLLSLLSLCVCVCVLSLTHLLSSLFLSLFLSPLSFSLSLCVSSSLTLPLFPLPRSLSLPHSHYVALPYNYFLFFK